MGEVVKRPVKEGVGERPTTPKPNPRHMAKSMAGERPHTPKPSHEPMTSERRLIDK